MRHSKGLLSWTDTSNISASKPLLLVSFYLLSQPTHTHTRTHTHTHTDNELFVRLLSKSVKWPVLSPSCHTQALSVQTPKSGLFSHLHPSSRPDLHSQHTQRQRLKGWKHSHLIIFIPSKVGDMAHTPRLQLSFVRDQSSSSTYVTFSIMLKKAEYFDVHNVVFGLNESSLHILSIVQQPISHS